MGGPNLEVFKFGMYIMFPIGIMYYFGTNLDSRFSVPDFWPKEGQTHTIPFEKDDIKEELERLRTRRLAARARRLAMQPNAEESADKQSILSHERQTLAETSRGAVPTDQSQKSQTGQSSTWSRFFGR